MIAEENFFVFHIFQSLNNYEYDKAIVITEHLFAENPNEKNLFLLCTSYYRKNYYKLAYNLFEYNHKYVSSFLPNKFLKARIAYELQYYDKIESILFSNKKEIKQCKNYKIEDIENLIVESSIYRSKLFPNDIIDFIFDFNISQILNFLGSFYIKQCNYIKAKNCLLKSYELDTFLNWDAIKLLHRLYLVDTDLITNQSKLNHLYEIGILPPNFLKIANNSLYITNNNKDSSFILNEKLNINLSPKTEMLSPLKTSDASDKENKTNNNKNIMTNKLKAPKKVKVKHQISHRKCKLSKIDQKNMLEKICTPQTSLYLTNEPEIPINTPPFIDIGNQYDKLIISNVNLDNKITPPFQAYNLDTLGTGTTMNAFHYNTVTLNSDKLLKNNKAQRVTNNKINPKKLNKIKSHPYKCYTNEVRKKFSDNSESLTLDKVIDSFGKVDSYSKNEQKITQTNFKNAKRRIILKDNNETNLFKALDFKTNIKSNTLARIDKCNQTENLNYVIEGGHLIRNVAQALNIISRAHSYLSRYETAEALNAFQQLVSAHHDLPYVLCLIAKTYYEMTDYHKACVLYEKAIKQRPFNIDGCEIYSSCLWHLKKHYELSALASVLSKEYRSSHVTWCVVANCFGLAGDHEQAIKSIKRAIQLNPEMPYAYTVLGHEYVSSGDLEMGNIAFQNAIKIDQNHYNAWYGLGMVSFKSEKYQKSEYYYKKALSINPKRAIMMCHLGIVYKQLCKYDQAMKCFDDTLKSDPKLILAKFYRAELLLNHQKNYNDALRELMELSQLAPDESKIYHSIAKVHEKMGRKIECLKYLDWALCMEQRHQRGKIGPNTIGNFSNKDKIRQDIDRITTSLEINLHSTDLITQNTIEGSQNYSFANNEELRLDETSESKNSYLMQHNSGVFEPNIKIASHLLLSNGNDSELIPNLQAHLSLVLDNLHDKHNHNYKILKPIKNSCDISSNNDNSVNECSLDYNFNSNQIASSSRYMELD